ncbi:MAG: hypothetical protein A2X67_00765 [Ignavibacteria bacterium GWA2_55_11]|nr:MAG: hypothetical protein A2X67_00765 [Ignavibacteria bacterium GWA2_55_11]
MLGIDGGITEIVRRSAYNNANDHGVIAVDRFLIISDTGLFVLLTSPNNNGEQKSGNASFGFYHIDASKWLVVTQIRR